MKIILDPGTYHFGRTLQLGSIGLVGARNLVKRAAGRAARTEAGEVTQSRRHFIRMFAAGHLVGAAATSPENRPLSDQPVRAASLAPGSVDILARPLVLSHRAVAQKLAHAVARLA